MLGLHRGCGNAQAVAGCAMVVLYFTTHGLRHDQYSYYREGWQVPRGHG